MYISIYCLVKYPPNTGFAKPSKGRPNTLPAVAVAFKVKNFVPVL